MMQLLALFLLATDNAPKTFYLVGANEEAATIVDQSTVKQVGQHRGAMLTLVFSRPMAALGKDISTAEMLMEFDCQAHLSRNLRMIGRTIDGDYVGEDSRPSDWQPVDGGMAEAEALVCRGKLPTIAPESSASPFARAYHNLLTERAGSH